MLCKTWRNVHYYLYTYSNGKSVAIDSDLNIAKSGKKERKKKKKSAA